MLGFGGRVGRPRISCRENSNAVSRAAALAECLLRCMGQPLAPLRHADGRCECLLVGVDRKHPTGSRNDAIDRAPRGRELSVREGLTRIIVDWSGSWQAAQPGNWLGRSPATKAALGC